MSRERRTPEVTERTALLRAGHEDDDEHKNVGKEESRSALRELGFLALRALPVSAAYALQNSLSTGSIVICGQLGSDALSAAAQSYMLAMLAFTVAHGGASAMDTLAAPLYSTPGADRTLIGLLLQRCCFALLILYLPWAIAFFFAEPILLALGQPETLAVNVQSFMRVLAFGIPGYLCFETIKRLYQATGLMHAATLVLCITSPINVGLNILATRTFGWGLIGAAYATSISYYLSCFILAAAIPFTRARECWGGFSVRAFKHLRPMFALAIPGAISVATEWISFEIVALGAGKLGDLPLAAQSAIGALDQIITTMPFGQGAAASSRIGNLLGARNARMATRSSHVAILLSILVGAATLTVLLSARDYVGLLFTDDRQVVRAVSDVLIPVALFQVADGVTQSTGGIMRGVGKQHQAALANLIAYYVIGLPIGFALAFRAGWGLQGLWTGNALALTLAGIGQWIYVARLDYNHEADLAAQRNVHDRPPVDTDEV